MQKLRLVILVDIFDSLRLQSFFTLALHIPVPDGTSKGKPDCLVLILKELGIHAYDLIVVELLHIEGHLVALLETVVVFIIQDKF